MREANAKIGGLEKAKRDIQQELGEVQRAGEKAKSELAKAKEKLAELQRQMKKEEGVLAKNDDGMQI